MTWFMNEGKYCLLFYVMMAICFGMGWIAGAAYLSLFWAITWTVSILFFCVMLSSYLMILDYQRYKALKALDAQLKETEGE